MDGNGPPARLYYIPGEWLSNKLKVSLYHSSPGLGTPKDPPFHEDIIF